MTPADRMRDSRSRQGLPLTPDAATAAAIVAILREKATAPAYELPGAVLGGRRDRADKPRAA